MHQTYYGHLPPVNMIIDHRYCDLIHQRIIRHGCLNSIVYEAFLWFYTFCNIFSMRTIIIIEMCWYSVHCKEHPPHSLKDFLACLFKESYRFSYVTYSYINLWWSDYALNNLKNKHLMASELVHPLLLAVITAFNALSASVRSTCIIRHSLTI